MSTAWTTANLQQLFTAMKNCISEKDKDCAYSKGLKSLEWEKVAFLPFSASECEDKWMGILRKVLPCLAISLFSKFGNCNHIFTD